MLIFYAFAIRTNYKLEVYGDNYSSSPLPVELSHFEGTAFNCNTIALNWATLTETDNSHFIVEHSVNGINFETVGIVTGQGNSTEISHYSFIHENIEQKQNYYRLKQVDFDGNFEYSKVVVVDCDDTKKVFFYLFPNPTSGNINLSSNGYYQDNLALEIIDNTGKLLRNQSLNIGAGEVQHISLDNYPAGMYLIRIRSEGEFFNYRVVKLE